MVVSLLVFSPALTLLKTILLISPLSVLLYSPPCVDESVGWSSSGRGWRSARVRVCSSLPLCRLGWEREGFSPPPLLRPASLLVIVPAR